MSLNFGQDKKCRYHMGTKVIIPLAECSDLSRGGLEVISDFFSITKLASYSSARKTITVFSTFK